MFVAITVCWPVCVPGVELKSSACDLDALEAELTRCMMGSGSEDVTDCLEAGVCLPVENPHASFCEHSSACTPLCNNACDSAAVFGAWCPLVCKVRTMV